MAEWQMNSQPEKEGKYLVRYCYVSPWHGITVTKEVKANRKKDVCENFYWILDFGAFIADPAIVAWKELE